MPTIQISARVDTKLKEKAQEVFARQGLDISTAIKMLITKTANEQAIPMSLTDADDKYHRDYIQLDPDEIEEVKSFGVCPDIQGRVYVNQTTQNVIDEDVELAEKIKSGEIKLETGLPSENHRKEREEHAGVSRD